MDGLCIYLSCSISEEERWSKEKDFYYLLKTSIILPCYIPWIFLHQIKIEKPNMERHSILVASETLGLNWLHPCICSKKDYANGMEGIHLRVCLPNIKHPFSFSASLPNCSQLKNNACMLPHVLTMSACIYVHFCSHQ